VADSARAYAQVDSLDDIVTDLRALAALIDDAQGKANVTMLSGHLLAEAADEIEALRAAGDALLMATTVEMVASLSTNNAATRAACNGWHRARRNGSARDVEMGGQP